MLITNTKNTFYDELLYSLNNCDKFEFCVAFINFSGINLLLDTFKNLEKKGVKGTIITSTYLNFTDPYALKRINEFKNIELLIYEPKYSEGFHPKSYIFYGKEEHCLIGSSNITANAFKKNIEWNIKTSITNNIKEEFLYLKDNSFEITNEFLEMYQNFRNNQSFRKPFTFDSFKPNSFQIQALKNLSALRKANETKALIIAATGVGKTILAALDVKQNDTKKILFVVHLENILLKAKKSFEDVLHIKDAGIYSGTKKERDKNFLFATIQSLSSNLDKFNSDDFEYIIIDEAHHSASSSYEKILNFFKPKFLLGLSATPVRADDKSIFDIFDNNIALDFRLNDALNNNLVTPFHYFGISDIETPYTSDISVEKLSRLLQTHKRVDLIVKKLNFYGYSGDKRRVIGFCVDKEHSKYMSNEFNKLGITSAFITSESSIEHRENLIKRLEDSKNSLEVIFSVNIFNEGIDIPSLNTILFLRPTTSNIIFTQQLGRGLRIYKNKEYVTILDFIGNHDRAFMIAYSLLGEKVIDKDSIKVAMKNSFFNIDKSCFVNFDEISSQRILQSLDNTNLSKFSYLKEEFLELQKNLYKKELFLSDFISLHNEVDPVKYIKESKSFIEFKNKILKNNDLEETFIKAIRFIESLIPIKRVYEFAVLNHLIENESLALTQANTLIKKYLDTPNKQTIKHSFEYLNFTYLDSAQKSRYLQLVSLENNTLTKTNEFKKILENSSYKHLIKDSINYGLLRYEIEFGRKNYGLPFFKLYEKYNMSDIALVCNLDKIHSSFRGSGQLKFRDDYFLFINLEKEKFSLSANHTNIIYDEKTLSWESKPNITQVSIDGNRLINNKKENINLHIFMRKSVKVDGITQNFIYLGCADTKSYEGEKPIKFIFELHNNIPTNIYLDFVT